MGKGFLAKAILPKGKGGMCSSCRKEISALQEKNCRNIFMKRVKYSITLHNLQENKMLQGKIGLCPAERRGLDGL